MKRMVLLCLVSVSGASLYASKAPDYKLLLDDALGHPKDGAKAAVFTKAIRDNFVDIDTQEYERAQTLAEYLADQDFNATGDLKDRLDDLYEVLEQHRSEPDKVDEFRVLIKAAEGDADKLAELEAFLKDKCLNIDLIVYDPNVSPDTIATVLERKKTDPLAVTIFKLARINNYRYYDYYVTVLCDLMINVLVHNKLLMVFFESYYTKMRDQKMSVDLDKLMLGGQALSDMLNQALENDDVKAGALLIAEYVQADRTDKEATVRALFKAFEKDVKHAEVLKEWFKNHPVDVDAVAYDSANAAGDKLGTKLNALVTSPDTAVQVAAIAVADLVGPHREAGIPGLKSFVEAYKKDKTKLAADNIKDWLKLHPVDIDSVFLDRAKPQGGTLGDSINALNDDVLSAIFKDSRSKVPQPSRSWLSPRNLAIGVIVGTSMYLWHRHQSQNGEQEKGNQLPVFT